MSLVRSALWGQKDKNGKQRRIVTYGVHPAERIAIFEGQIIFTGNRPLQDIPELRALATRISVQEVPVTNDELLALMKQICQSHYVTDKGVLTSDWCWQVLDKLVAQWPQNKAYNIRILERCFSALIGVQQLKDQIKSGWEEIIAAEIKGGASPDPITRDERIAQETIIAVDLAKKQLPRKELLAEWHRLTGNRTLDTYYRRLRSIR
jgi:hypothetical protein